MYPKYENHSISINTNVRFSLSEFYSNLFYFKLRPMIIHIYCKHKKQPDLVEFNQQNKIQIKIQSNEFNVRNF